jgi:methylenetetrahydrofolate reductase (NADPH)
MQPLMSACASVLVDNALICAFSKANRLRTVRPMAAPEHDFEVVWEIEPPLHADVEALHGQLISAAGVATSILVPDNHTGRATVSSIAIAREVASRGFAATACLNARDRNLLGLRRDLLTCAFDGVDDLLLVYGDEPDIGSRASDLTVRAMVEECGLQAPEVRVGVTSRLRPLPAWKRAADRLFVQVSYDLDALLRWRDQLTFDGPVLPAVMVVPSVAMARRLAARVPDLRVPEHWLVAIDRDPAAGVDLACDLVARIRASGGFDGVHLIGGRRHREAADGLRMLATAPHPRAVIHA